MFVVYPMITFARFVARLPAAPGAIQSQMIVKITFAKFAHQKFHDLKAFEQQSNARLLVSARIIS